VTEQPTKQCRKCGEAKPLLAFAGRQNTCIACREEQRTKTQERKDAVAWSPELGERITDMQAAGMTIAEVCAQAAMPTARQLKAWRRANPDFDAACDLAEMQSAAAHVDKAKEALRQAEAGKIPVSDAKGMAETHLKLASVLHPKRYGSHATVDVTSQGKPLVDFGAAVKALLDVLPRAALPAPSEAIDVEVVPTPEERTLQ
jgi:hypothetical protein